MKESINNHVRPLVRDVLRNWINRKWSLQGFGMLRTYISKELRLHVWDRRFVVPNVTMVHDHPWDFESLIVAGRIANTRYQVHRCTDTDDQLAPFVRRPFIKAQIELNPNRPGGMPPEFIKAQIICGPGTGEKNAPSKLKLGGERVWLVPLEPENYGVGDTYWQQAGEVHHTSYSHGAITLVHRHFKADTEHAHVFFKANEEWVSAEPRDATPDEVSQIVDHALSKF